MKQHNILIAKQFPTHHLKKGQPTFFEDLILRGIKQTTIRTNYEYWKKRIDEVSKGEAKLVLKQWINRPYHDSQTTIHIETFEPTIEKVKIDFRLDNYYVFSTELNQWLHFNGIEQMAKMDGLTIVDFKSWFKSDKHDPNIELARIKFNIK